MEEEEGGGRVSVPADAARPAPVTGEGAGSIGWERGAVRGGGGALQGMLRGLRGVLGASVLRGLQGCWNRCRGYWGACRGAGAIV